MHFGWKNPFEKLWATLSFLQSWFSSCSSCWSVSTRCIYLTFSRFYCFSLEDWSQWLETLLNQWLESMLSLMHFSLEAVWPHKGLHGLLSHDQCTLLFLEFHEVLTVEIFQNFTPGSPIMRKTHTQYNHLINAPLLNIVLFFLSFRGLSMKILARRTESGYLIFLPKHCENSSAGFSPDEYHRPITSPRLALHDSRFKAMGSRMKSLPQVNSYVLGKTNPSSPTAWTFP